MPAKIRKFIDIIKRTINDRGFDISQRVYILVALNGTLYAFLLSIVYFIYGGALIPNASLLFVTVVVLLLLLFYSIRTGKYNVGAVCTILWASLVLLPGIFFLGGGVNGSVSIWFIIGFTVSALMSNGVLRLLFIGLDVIIFIACYVISYYHPHLVIPRTEFMWFLDSLIAVLAIGWMVTLMINYQEIVGRREKTFFENQKKELAILSRSQQDFYFHMNRRIRTPITTITGLNEITLKNENIPENVANNTRSIYSACRMLLSLIDDILDLNKSQAGNLELASEKYGTANIFADIFSMLEGRAREKGLELKFDISPNFPAYLIGDEVRIKQVLVNIVTNAVKYTREGSVTIKAVGEEREGIFYSEYDVIDTGIGIKEEDLKKLFSDYQRLDLQENKGVEGTGLGLSIVKLFTNLMGGSVSVTSEYKKGSDFKVIIPQKTWGNETIGHGDAESVNLLGIYQNKSFSVETGRVLVVDDDNMNRLVVKKLLQGTGVIVDEASEGRIALELTKEFSYDIIFMDHMMPGMDGAETLRRIRAQVEGLCRDVPVVALTANVGSDIEEYYFRLGFDGYLAKPIDGKLLERYIKAVVSRTPESRNIRVERKVPFMVTTDSLANIPESEAENLGIGVLYCFVRTDNGIRFRDNDEIKPKEVEEYFKKGKGQLFIEPPSEEETEKFFRQMKEKAIHIIHISMSAGFADSNYSIVSKVAKKLGGISVVDSGLIYTGQGLLALMTAKLVRNEQSLEHILEYVEEKKHQAELRLIFKNNTQRGKRILLRLMGYFKLCPLVTSKNGHIGFKGFLKSSESIYDNFLDRLLSEEDVSDEVLFISCLGVPNKKIEQIKEKAMRRKEFHSVYIAGNTAATQVGLKDESLAFAFMRKGHNA